MDFNIELSGGVILRGFIQSPGESTRAVIVMVHGVGEHIKRYNNWADLFKKEGIGFAGVDLPGHGRSDGKRGYIRNYSILAEMIDILIKTASRTFPGIPLYLYGQSLGGGIVLVYILHRSPRIKGAIITSPWLRLAFEPPKIKVIIASVLKYFLPSLIQPSGLNTSHLSRNKAVVEKYNTDPLVHSKISVSLFHAAMGAAAYSLSHGSELRIPTLILHGSDDQITSPEGSKEFASLSNMAELKIWDGGFHELHNEPDSKEVFKYIISWISRQA